jgi:ribosomal protein L34
MLCAAWGRSGAGAHTDQGFVARVWAKIGKMPQAMQRIAGFVARVRAKTGKMPHVMQRIAGFVARPGAQQGEKVLCVQCMQRISRYCARPGQKIAQLPTGVHTIGLSVLRTSLALLTFFRQLV